MKKTLQYSLSVGLMIFFLSPTLSAAERCVAPDNGGGTVSLPANCPYVNEGGTLNIVEGLPLGTTLECDYQIDSFFDVFTEIGGPMGGEMIEFGAIMHLHMSGTGMLLGYLRDIDLPISVVMYTAPRIPGESRQIFGCTLGNLEGALTPGDPDFDKLSIIAGESHGFPAPGGTTLTRLPDGRYNVDSFFDVFFETNFAGAPGGPLAGYSGITTGPDSVRTHQGENGWDHCDVFNITFDATGWMAEGGGSGYDGGTFFYYPNTEWWNEWYYDGVLDLSRVKNVLLTVTITPTGADADATVAINYSSPNYPPGTGQPPLPPLSPEDEAAWIVRDVVFVAQDLAGPVTQTFLHSIINFNPEWVSIDVMGTNVIIEGDICHSCLDVQFPEGEPPIEGEPEGEGEPPVEGEGEPPVEGELEGEPEGEGEIAPDHGINISVQVNGIGLPGTDINSALDGDTDPPNDVYKAGGCTNLMRLRHRLLGLQPADDIDAISYRTNDLALGALDTHGMYDSLMRPIHWHFSVDQQSQGVGGTAVSNEVTVGTASCGVPVAQLPEASGDIFVTSAANWNSNALAADEADLGLVVQLPDDNLNGLDLRAPLINRLSPAPGQYLQPGDLFFSLTKGSPSLALAGVTAADILTPDGAGFFRVALMSDGLIRNGDHVTLGIPADNDLDALFVDKNGLAIFSVAQLILILPTAGPGDLLVADGMLPWQVPDGVADVLAGAAVLGLQAADNLDALDAALAVVPADVVPEPGEDLALYEGPIEGEGEPPVEGEGEAPVEGEGEPPVEGEGEPPVEGEGEPPVEGEGEPPVEGEGEPPVEGEGEPPVEGEGEPPVEGEVECVENPEGCPRPLGGDYEIGSDLCLCIPCPVSSGSTYTWAKDSTPLANGGRVSGANARTLQIVMLTTGDSGLYSCTYNDGTKAIKVFEAQVTVVDQIPVMGTLGLIVLAAAGGALGLLARKKRM